MPRIDNAQMLSPELLKCITINTGIATNPLIVETELRAFLFVQNLDFETYCDKAKILN